MKYAYKDKTFRSGSLAIIAQSNQIIEGYAAKGFDLTLRQTYYQFVARDLFPDDRRWRWTGSRWVRDPNGTKNAPPNYKWLGGLVNDGRLAGLIDWDAIVDRTRNYQAFRHYEDPSHCLRSAARNYLLNVRDDQPQYVEVWVEKDALIGVIESACDPLDVGYFSCRGYVSQSEMWGAAQRLMRQEDTGKETFIIHLGDHDPSGIQMTEDIQNRLDMFHSSVEVERIALNMNQVKQYGPPPNPAKTTDSRYAQYRAVHGDESWELDALEPQVLARLISDAVAGHTDQELVDDLTEEQEQGRLKIQDVANNWEA